jgi:S1-C subfamily serine protease
VAQMQDTTLLDTIERYIRGEMSPEEKAQFEQLRNTNPEVDQLVVEHSLFMDKFAQYGVIQQFKNQLKDVHNQYVREGGIVEQRPAIVVTLWKKYKRTVFVAASIAGITALVISGLISLLSPKVKPSQLEYLSGQIAAQGYKLNKLDTKVNSAETPVPSFSRGGTGFLVDGKGYLVTAAHIFKNATQVEVQNSLGEYHARIIQLDRQADLALLKIEDTTYHAFTSLPYGISKSGAELGEDVFTLGYPRPEIVYGKGYMSAKTGYQGDTTNFQLTIAANPGNSGTPVLNNDGEVVGMVSSAQQNAQGMVFAVRSRNIFQALEAMRSDSTLLSTDSTISRLKIPVNSFMKGMERKTQLKRLEDYIFIVKSN